MFESIFEGLFDSGNVTVIEPGIFLLCIGVSILVGLFTAFAYSFKSRCSRSMMITLVILPAVVSGVIMMVNGNIGAGVAVAGAFGLVRFRSAPGSARDICILFLETAAGLMIGMGYLGFGVLFTILLGVVFMLLSLLNFGGCFDDGKMKILRITVPEDMNYTEAFDDLFEVYTTRHEMLSSKTTNLGSLFRLSYLVCLRDEKQEKAFIDQLRCRNGNLEISIARQDGPEMSL